MAKVYGAGHLNKSVPRSPATPVTSFESYMGAPPEAFGADINSAVFRSKVHQTVDVIGGERPSNLLYRYNGVTSFWHNYALMDWYNSEVSALSTLNLRNPSELLRYGLIWVPKFAYKCEDCGHELDTYSRRCPVCQSTRLRKPDEHQKDYFIRPNGKSFLDEANDSHQSMVDVVFAYAQSEFQNNQSYLLCVTGNVIDHNTGELLRGYPMEFIFQDPKYVKYLYDDTGKPGTRYAFTMRNRQTVYDIDKNPEALQITNDNGDVLYPAEWQIGQNYGGTGPCWYYTGEEVYQDKWFTQSMIYGVPIWFDMEDDLLTYHYVEKLFYKRYQNGFVRKILLLPGFDDEAAEAITQGVQSVLATNNSSIPIICTPPPMPGTPELRAQAIELGAEDINDALAVKDDIRHRMCAHVGVTDIFAGDAMSSGGMNNESQQITVYDRSLARFYDKIDRLLEYIVSWFPQIQDWALVVNRPGKAHTEHMKRMDELEFVAKMKQLGFDVKYIDGEYRFSEEPMDQVQRRAQEKMQAQQMQMQMMQPPQMPPQGEDPDREHGGPDKGTARREDPEIDAAKEEVEESMDESSGEAGAM